MKVIRTLGFLDPHAGMDMGQLCGWRLVNAQRHKHGKHPDLDRLACFKDAGVGGKSWKLARVPCLPRLLADDSTIKREVSRSRTRKTPGNNLIKRNT